MKEIPAYQLFIARDVAQLLQGRANIPTNYATDQNLSRLKTVCMSVQKQLVECPENQAVKALEGVKVDEEKDPEGAKKHQEELAVALKALQAKEIEVNSMLIEFEPYQYRMSRTPEDIADNAKISTLLPVVEEGKEPSKDTPATQLVKKVQSLLGKDVTFNQLFGWFCHTLDAMKDDLE